MIRTPEINLLEFSAFIHNLRKPGFTFRQFFRNFSRRDKGKSLDSFISNEKKVITAPVAPFLYLRSGVLPSLDLLLYVIIPIEGNIIVKNSLGVGDSGTIGPDLTRQIIFEAYTLGAVSTNLFYERIVIKAPDLELEDKIEAIVKLYDADCLLLSEGKGKIRYSDADRAA